LAVGVIIFMGNIGTDYRGSKNARLID